MVDTVSQIRSEGGVELTSRDWARIALAQKGGHAALQTLLFPRAPGGGVAPRLRSRDVLTEATDAGYEKVYNLLRSDNSPGFPDLDGLLKTARSDGKRMSEVAAHVGYWLNPDIRAVIERSTNKPQLRQDFVPALEQAAGHPEADAASIELEEFVVAYAIEHSTDFASLQCSEQLKTLPAADWSTYNTRFTSAVWAGLLQLVRDFVGLIDGRPVLLRVDVVHVDVGLRADTAADFAAITIAFARQHRLATEEPGCFADAALDDLRAYIRRWISDHSSATPRQAPIRPRGHLPERCTDVTRAEVLAEDT